MVDSGEEMGMSRERDPEESPAAGPAAEEEGGGGPRKRGVRRRRQRKPSAPERSAALFAGIGPETPLRVYDERAFERLRMPRAPHWAVAWSDLMMTMFILFAVLYIYQSANRELVLGSGAQVDFPVPGATGIRGGLADPFGRGEDNNLTRIYDVGRKTVREANLDDFAAVKLAPDKTVRIVLTGDLLFDSGSADLKPQSFDALARIAELVAQTPYMITVAGHTDDMPISTAEFPSNWELSLVRASRVARFLMERTGIGQERFAVTGHASFVPLAPNSSAENRAANRRVEIVLTREKPGVAPGAGGNNDEV